MNYLDRILIKRFIKIAHRAHVESGLELAYPIYDRTDPYKALIQLMQNIMAQLSDIPNISARQRVFYYGMESAMIRFLGGKCSVALIARFMGLLPNFGAKLMNVLTPVTFQWLVGPIVKHDIYGSHIPFCWFRKTLGDKACIEFCQKPTQSFFIDSLNIPLTLLPSNDGHSCSIKYGIGQK